jgi:hypothetical protein
MLINVVYSLVHLTNEISVLLIMTSCENNPLNSKCTIVWVKTNIYIQHTITHGGAGG